MGESLQLLFEIATILRVYNAAMLTIGDAARRFRDGSLTPEALTNDCLAAIARENPRINAFTEVFERSALEEASSTSRAA
jgi:Asp-tRNA(Asn)/Glu-tRNA(Gln) amidotransferase A subunit family amidase